MAHSLGIRRRHAAKAGQAAPVTVRPAAARLVALFAALAALAAAWLADGPVRTADASPHPIGYLYASTLTGHIDEYAVAPDYSLKVIGSVSAAQSKVLSLAVLHTKGGMFLYASESTSGEVGDIYQYAINRANGKLTATKEPPITGVVTGVGDGLLAFDGFATNTADADAIYANACVSPADCTQTGFAHYSVNQSTGALKLDGTVTPIYIDAQSISGAEIDQLTNGSHDGDNVVPIKIDPHTGNILTGAPFALTESDDPSIPSQASVVATAPGRVGVGPVKVSASTAGPAVYPSTGLALSQGDSTVEAGGTTALSFTAHHLLAGETGPTQGPQLELFSPDGAASDGVIDLTQAPYDESSGSEEEPNFVTTIFTLGKGVYIGTYAGAAIEATDGVGGNGFVINKSAPKVADSFSTYGMAGFLYPQTTATKTKVSATVKAHKVHVSGSVNAGVKNTDVTVTLLRLTGSKYKPLGTDKPKLSSSHAFAATFAEPSAGKCEVTAHYPGTATTSASHATKKFAC